MDILVHFFTLIPSYSGKGAAKTVFKASVGAESLQAAWLWL